MEIGGSAIELLNLGLSRVSNFAGIVDHLTIVSMPRVLGFWVAEEVQLARRDLIVRGREFAHLHPDGVLHASLPPALADDRIWNPLGDGNHFGHSSKA